MHIASASAESNLDVLKLLLSSGADLNCEDDVSMYAKLIQLSTMMIVYTNFILYRMAALHFMWHLMLVISISCAQ